MSYDYSCGEWEKRSNVIILKWVFSWEWGVVRVASELVRTLEDMSGNNTLQGNTEHRRTHLPEKLLSPTKLKLTDMVSPLLLMS